MYNHQREAAFVLQQVVHNLEAEFAHPQEGATGRGGAHSAQDSCVDPPGVRCAAAGAHREVLHQTGHS